MELEERIAGGINTAVSRYSSAEMTARSGNIYLCGMIGSGKTTIGLYLAHELELPLYDLDREMDRILGHSFHRLVREKGWVAFRELEYSICKRFARHEKCLICLGAALCAMNGTWMFCGALVFSSY